MSQEADRIIERLARRIADENCELSFTEGGYLNEKDLKEKYLAPLARLLEAGQAMAEDDDGKVSLAANWDAANVCGEAAILRCLEDSPFVLRALQMARPPLRPPGVEAVSR